MTRTRSWRLALLMLALAAGIGACGKYGPPQRMGTDVKASAAMAAEEAECEDEEPQQ